ncbi:hypothetical protein Tco_0439852 [Tanacetum coccineum]
MLVIGYTAGQVTAAEKFFQSDSEVDSCSKSCVKAYATLKEHMTVSSPAVESFVNLSDKSGSDKGYHSVPPPLTGNFIPRKPDLTFMDEIVESENLDVTTVVTPSNDKTVENKGVFNTIESNTVRRECCASINEELASDGKKKTIFPTVSKIEFVGPKQPEKPVRKPVRKIQVSDDLEISTASPEVKTAGDSIKDIAAKTLVYIRRSAAKAKDKGKEERQRISKIEGLIQELLQKIFIQAKRSRKRSI